MTAKIAAVLALLLALSGWGLYRQVSANGKMHEQIQQIEADLKAERGRVENLRYELEARDEAVRLLQVRYDELHAKKAKIQTIVRKVYVQPEVQDWAKAAPPVAVRSTVGACIERLWRAEGDNAACGAGAAGRDAP